MRYFFLNGSFEEFFTYFNLVSKKKSTQCIILLLFLLFSQIKMGGGVDSKSWSPSDNHKLQKKLMLHRICVLFPFYYLKGTFFLIPTLHLSVYLFVPLYHCLYVYFSQCPSICVTVWMFVSLLVCLSAAVLWTLCPCF